MRIHSLFILLLACLLLNGCAAWRKNYAKPLPAGQVALVKITDPARIPDFRDAYYQRDLLAESILNSEDYFTHPSSQEYFPYLDISHSRAIRSLEKFRALLQTARTADEFQQAIVRDFDVYESVGCDGMGTVLFTGYCTPIYEASRVPTAEFRYPLYKRPADLVTDPQGAVLGRETPSGAIVPYYTRAEIQRGNLLEGLELVYLKDPLEAFLVHVQGSAKLRMRDGSIMEVGYAGKNGRPYSSLGKMLTRDGKLHPSRVSLTTIKDYFKRHPEELDVYLPRNESFVFFRETHGGPYGSLNQPVLPYRSIATDKNKVPGDVMNREPYPRGCLAFLDTKLPMVMPDGSIKKQDWKGFVLDQDNGGAIRSAGRVDVYLGEGATAELLAGHAVAEGKIYYIFVKPALYQHRL